MTEVTSVRGQKSRVYCASYSLRLGIGPGTQAVLLDCPMRDGEWLKKLSPDRQLGLGTGEADGQEGLCGTAVTNSSLKDVAGGALKELCFVPHGAFFCPSSFFNSQLRCHFREALLIALPARLSLQLPV